MTSGIELFDLNNYPFEIRCAVSASFCLPLKTILTNDDDDKDMAHHRGL